MNLQSVKQRFSIIGRSEKLDRALGKAMRVANTDLTVLIQGESGVGKEGRSGEERKERGSCGEETGNCKEIGNPEKRESEKRKTQERGFRRSIRGSGSHRSRIAFKSIFDGERDHQERPDRDSR